MVQGDGNVTQTITSEVSGRLAHMWAKKRGCLTLSFVMPALMVGVLYLDELLFSGADIALTVLPCVVAPALLAGLSGTALYVCIKMVRPCAHNKPTNAATPPLML